MPRLTLLGDAPHGDPLITGKKTRRFPYFGKSPCAGFHTLEKPGMRGREPILE